jgi:hypothetical protein
MKDIKGKELQEKDVILVACKGLLEITQVLSITDQITQKVKLSCYHAMFPFGDTSNLSVYSYRNGTVVLPDLVFHNGWYYKQISNFYIIDKDLVNVNKLKPLSQLKKEFKEKLNKET